MAVTLSFQSTGAIPGKGAPHRMNGPSLTIGRGDENDLVLPDPDKLLSKRHCVIEDHNGNLVVVDISTNGTFLNYGKVPLGATPTPLNDGDILCLGPYELMVCVRSETASDPLAAIPDPLGEGPVSHGNAAAAPGVDDLLDGPAETDFLDDLLGGPEGPTGHKGVTRPELGDDGVLPPLGEDDLAPPAPDPHAELGGSIPSHSPAARDHFQPRALDAPAQVIPDDWDDDLLGPGRAEDPFADAPLSAPSEDPLPEAPTPEIAAPQGTPPAPAPDPAVQPDPPGAPVPPPVATPGDIAAARAFLEALGEEAGHVSDEELPALMARMGAVMRMMIEGLREILMTRSAIKSEFRIEQTQISAGGNNPLKFSISAEQAIQAMVKPTTRGYLPADEAAREALSDIKAHEVATITGMEAALKGILARLDPAVLEERIQTGGGLGAMLKSRKAQYWDIYERMYAEIADQAENDFHDLFAKEFARAYRAQMERIK